MGACHTTPAYLVYQGYRQAAVPAGGDQLSLIPPRGEQRLENMAPPQTTVGLEEAARGKLNLTSPTHRTTLVLEMAAVG